jgi:RNA polymerase sigma factor (sigma-70 family)
MGTHEVDQLIAAAQRGDRDALDRLCAHARPLLLRHARRVLGRSADVEDAVQEVLIIACARLSTYRWDGSFAGWLYTIATRAMLRRARRGAVEAERALELADLALLTDHDPLTNAEWNLVEQELHLACTLGVLTALEPAMRRLYLLGEVLAVPDQVGARVMQVSPATYRKRLERARRSVAAAARSPTPPHTSDSRAAAAARELDNLVRLGELHRARNRGASGEGAVRALERIAPTLAA